MKLGFDIDGVVIDLTTQIIKAAKRRGWWPEGATIDDITQHHMPPLFGWSDDQLQALLCPETYQQVMPYDDPLIDLEKWRERGAGIHYITARSEDDLPGLMDITQRTLAAWGLPGEVHFCPSKFKPDLVRRLGLDMYVEDYHVPVCALRDQGMATAFVMKRPWNIEVDGVPWRLDWEGVSWWVEWLFRAASLEQLEEDVDEFGEEMLKADGYDGAFLGVSYRFGQYPLLAYDRQLCIETLMRRDGMSEVEAGDFFEFNTLGAWGGEGTPVFVDRRE